MTNPVFEAPDSPPVMTRRVLPVYPLTAGLSNAALCKAVSQALALCDPPEEILPPQVRAEYGILPAAQAYRMIHSPASMEEAAQARKRMIFEEFFLFSAGLALLRYTREEKPGAVLTDLDLTPFYQALPFALTNAQNRAIGEIVGDFTKGRVMNRLVQGDVGSGKTMVAAAAAYLAVKNGFQAAMMAPTEILAEQHAASLGKLFAPLGIRVELLTGSLPQGQRRLVQDAMASGEAQIVVGTHALVAGSGSFSNLGLVITDEQHRENIRQGIKHCRRGDVFQIVMSRRFEQRYTGDDFNLYRALRSVNPSPYLFYFDFGSFRIFGSSPETHCRIEGNNAYIDPIAGTTRRGGDEKTDRKLTEALLADPKENAEHVMLVDLARNDLSRNCHDVKVVFFREPQYYSHVIHLVSRVSGELNAGTDSIKTFMDTFPAGTLSGAPKIRALQLISRYEPHNRGAYGGCIGFIGMNGELNQAITIRTFVSRNNTLWFQAGGGIVAKSDVEQEMQEVKNKLGALEAAIRIAEKYN